jgi:integrase
MPRKKQPEKFKYTHRKNGKLYVIFPLPGLKTRVWRTCYDETQEGVNEIIRQIKEEYEKELTENKIPESCEKFFDFWLKLIKTRVTERTHQGYENHVDRYLRPELKHLAIGEVKPLHFSVLYQKMLDNGLDPVTIRHTHRVAMSLFKEAVNLEVIQKNPVAKVKPPKENNSDKIKTLSLNEAKLFLAACQKARHGVIFEFALETGMRPQEYLAMRWQDVDLEKMTVRVNRALVYDRKGGGFYFKEPKTKKSRRTIKLSPQMVEKLKTHKQKQNETLEEIRERLRRRIKPSRLNRREYNKQLLKNHADLNLVFPSQDFTPFKDINLGRRYFKPIIEELKFDGSLSLYALRHTCATLLLQANVNPKKVSERLGHSSVVITLDTYSHVLPSMQEEVTGIMGDIIYS